MLQYDIAIVRQLLLNPELSFPAALTLCNATALFYALQIRQMQHCMEIILLNTKGLRVFMPAKEIFNCTFWVKFSAVQRNFSKVSGLLSLQNKLPLYKCISIFDNTLIAKYYCAASSVVFSRDEVIHEFCVRKQV